MTSWKIIAEIEDSSSSNTSLSSDYMEDTSSSSSSSSSNGPLYHLSHLMDQLPIKRGLSKYYEGKSQSFASLASVQSLESLAKAENPYKKKIKYCKSFCGGLDCQKVLSPKANILKKGSSGLKRNCSNNFMATTSRLHHVPLQKHF